MKTGIADLPLHGGTCPARLFKHMKALSMALIEIIIVEAGSLELLRRYSQPNWFQALGCVPGFASSPLGDREMVANLFIPKSQSLSLPALFDRSCALMTEVYRLQDLPINPSSRTIRPY